MSRLTPWLDSKKMAPWPKPGIPLPAVQTQQAAASTPRPADRVQREDES
jgi:hypothetical protein